MKDQLFELSNISFSYRLGKLLTQAIKDISLKIPSKSLTTFSGPSGSGKSTLLNILGLIEPVQEGKVLFKGEDVSSITEKQKNRIRKFDIGFIFQQFHLIPVLTAEENVTYFLQKQGLQKDEISSRTEETLKAVGLWEHRKKKPSELSGGQRQRVAIARAVAKRPAVIIADEPTASLDQKNGKEIMTLFEELVEEKQLSIILTTHDPMVMEFSKLNFHIQDGILIQ